MQTTLTDEQILAEIEIVRDQGNFHSLAFPTDAATIAFARAILAAVPAQPTQPQPGPELKERMVRIRLKQILEPSHGSLSAAWHAADALYYLTGDESYAVKADAIQSLDSAQPQQVEGAAPTDSTGSIRPSAEPAGQLDAHFPMLPDAEIVQAWDELGGLDGWLKHFGYIQFAHAIEDKLATRFRAEGGNTKPVPSESTLSLEPAKASGVQVADLTPDQKHEILELARVSADSYCDGAGVEPSQIESDAIFFDAIMRAVFNPIKEPK